MDVDSPPPSPRPNTHRKSNKSSNASKRQRVEDDSSDEEIEIEVQTKKRPSKSKRRARSISANSSSGPGMSDGEQGVESSRWATKKPEKHKKKGKSKAVEEGEVEKLVEQAEDSSSEEEEFFVPQRQPNFTPINDRWIEADEVQTVKGVYQDHLEPFTSLRGSPEQRQRAITLLLKNAGKYAVLATAWGKTIPIDRTRRIREAIERLTGHAPDITIIHENGTWILADCGKKENLRKVIEQRAMLHGSGTMILFRQVRKTPFASRYFVFKANEDEETTRLEAIRKLYPTATKVEKASRPSKHNEGFVVRVTFDPDDMDAIRNFAWPRELREDTWKSDVVKAPHCTGCHSDDHYEEDCRWRLI